MRFLPKSLGASWFCRILMASSFHQDVVSSPLFTFGAQTCARVPQRKRSIKDNHIILFILVLGIFVTGTEQRSLAIKTKSCGTGTYALHVLL
jgi:hypothetical protein